MRGVPKLTVGAPDFPRRPLADKFLYRRLVCVNAYKYGTVNRSIFQGGAVQVDVGRIVRIRPVKRHHPNCEMANW